MRTITTIHKKDYIIMAAFLKYFEKRIKPKSNI